MNMYIIKFTDLFYGILLFACLKIMYPIGIDDDIESYEDYDEL